MKELFAKFNNANINAVQRFYYGDQNILCLQAPNGGGKNEILDQALKGIWDDYLIFRYYSSELSTTEDFLLNFYDTLRNYSIERKIVLKKSIDEDFTKKVIGYFKYIDKRTLVVIDNFEKIDTNREAVSFLSNLAQNKNIKIILLSKKQVKLNGYEIQTIKIEPNSEETFVEKLSSVLQNIDKKDARRLFELTQGQELQLRMTLDYLKTTGASLKDLIEEAKRKNEDYETFMISKVMFLIPDTYMSFIYNLSLIDHPVSLEFLEKYKIATSAQIDYLVQRFILRKDGSEIYLREHLKSYFLNSLSVLEKLHYSKKIIEIYKNELTKGPKYRILRLSREGIRKRIEHLTSITPQVKNTKMSNLSANLIAQSKATDAPWLFMQGLNAPKKEAEPDKEDEGLLKKIRQDKILDKEKEDAQNLKNQIQKLLNQADLLQQDFQYAEAIKILQEAKAINADEKISFEICEKLANCYFAASKFQEAINHFSIISDYYRNNNEISKHFFYELKIAQAYSALYKTDNAKKIYEKIISSKQNADKITLAKAYFGLGQTLEKENNDDLALENYLQAQKFASKEKDTKLLDEIYYAAALLYDTKGDWERAKEYYLKGISNQGRHLSAYYSNLALIAMEQDNSDEAIEYFNLAIGEYQKAENTDFGGLYFVYKNLAQLYKNTDPALCEESLKEEYRLALKLDDNFKITNALVELGDFYYYAIKNKEALFSYLNAKYSSRGNISPTNIAMIDARIEDMRLKMGEADFNEALTEYEQSSN